MKKTFKYRIYARKETLAKAEAWIELSRNLYNCALAERIYAYKSCRKSLSYIHQQNELPEIRREFSEYQSINAQTLQVVLRRLNLAYDAFYRRVKKRQSGVKVGFPRFKGRNRYDSLVFTQSGWGLDGKYLAIRNIGRFKLHLSRPLEGTVKTVTIRRTPTNKWYACFSCNEVTQKLLPQSDKVVGIDVGIKSFLTDSEGNKVDNPKYLKKSLKELRVKQRKLARAKKGSSRRKDTKLQLSKCYEKVANQRSDFNHKLANEYIKKYGTIVYEKLKIKNMVKNRHLSRDINDCSWGQFFEYLTYKAEYAGREIIKVNPRNTSKMCSECGAINKDLTLNDRQWVCQSCGVLHDRDINASKNIKRLGRSYREVTYASTQSVS